MISTVDLVAMIAAYLLGSLSFARIVSRAMGLADPTSYGSGNPGATNVLRSGNKLAAALTLAGDAAKGVAAVLLARLIGPDFGLRETGVALVTLAVFIGHLYPVFFAFRGGKGVATAAGALWALDWRIGAGLTAVWLVVFAVTRVSSLAALLAAAAAPVLTVWLWGAGSTSAAVLAVALLLLWRHRGNIERLRVGKEAGFGSAQRRR